MCRTLCACAAHVTLCFVMTSSYDSPSKLRHSKQRIQSIRRSVKRVWRRETVAALLLASLKAVAVFVLPFLVYVRAAVSLYRHGANTWIALLGSAILTVGIVSGCVILIARRFRRRAR